MHVCLVCPAPAGSRLGNRITALRWQRLLRELGHAPFIVSALGARSCEVLIALHARRSADAVRLSRQRTPERPIVVVLTGTNLYRDIHTDEAAKLSLELANRLVVLHPGAAAELPARLRPKVRLVPQSAASSAVAPRRSTRAFEVAVVGHLRPEKDPLRTALAARLLPADSPVRVLHAGQALSDAMRRDAEAEQAHNPRYRWLGELPASQARRLIGRCRLLSLTSEMEGGANVISEALAAGTPIVASRIACTEALLGADYPGLFPFAATAELAALLARASSDHRFLADLARRCRSRRALVSAASETRALRSLLRELDGHRRD